MILHLSVHEVKATDTVQVNLLVCVEVIDSGLAGVTDQNYGITIVLTKNKSDVRINSALA